MNCDNPALPPEPPVPPAEPPPAPPNPPAFEFGEKLLLSGGLSNTPIAFTTSPDKDELSLLFDSLLIHHSGPEAPLAEIAVSAFEIAAVNPVDKPFLGYTVQVRGTCVKAPGSRATLVVQAGSAVHVREFPYGRELQEDWTGLFFSYEERGAQAAALPLPPLTIVTTLSVQRLNADENVLLTVDSIDIAAVRG